MNSSKAKLPLKVLYILSMAIAFTSKYGNIEVSYRPQIAIGVIWCFLGCVKFIHDGFSFKGTYGKELKIFLKVYLIPHVVIHVYTIALILLGMIEKKYLTTNLTVYVPAILSVTVIYLFGASAFKITYIALMLSWVLSFFCSITVGGVSVVMDAIKQGYFGYSVRNYLELHDMVFGLGYVILFISFTKKKADRYSIFLTITSTLIILLGVKRIQIAALLLIFLINIVFKFISVKLQYKLSTLGCMVFFLGSYIFIYLMSDESIVRSISEIVDMKGRNYYYTTILELSEFKITYPGIGRNVITRLLTTKYDYMHVGGVHSDIIKMYVENGFMLFGFWLWYYLVHIRHFFLKVYGYKAAIVYSIFAIYTFILYFTDNVEIYFITQMMNMILMMKMVLGKKQVVVAEE